MKQYQITVNGTVYEVEVEEIGGSSVVTMASAPASAPAPAAAPAASAPATASAASAPSAGAAVIESPMPGTILNVLVKPGDAVKENQVLLILEAMKMENEIVATSDGVVDTIAVAKGASVNAGDVLVSIK